MGLVERATQQLTDQNFAPKRPGADTHCEISQDFLFIQRESVVAIQDINRLSQAQGRSEGEPSYALQCHLQPLSAPETLIVSNHYADIVAMAKLLAERKPSLMVDHDSDYFSGYSAE